MKHVFLTRVAPCAVLVLAACASTPSGPSQVALPGTGKSFDQFRLDDVDCRQYAQYQTGNDPNKAGANSGVKSAAIGTGLGALAGVAIGNSGRAAATGAGVGLLAGSAIGVGTADRSASAAQGRYDGAYTQCMYGRGHKVAVAAQGAYTSQGETYAAPPPPAYGAPPPPPPGAAPVPPPGTIGPPQGADQSYSR
jgi:hypothetical protein